MSEIKNNYVTWRQLTFIAGVFIVVLGYMINLGLDTRERIVRLETNFDNLIDDIDDGKISIKYNK